jgi:hypothetical protein
VRRVSPRMAQHHCSNRRESARRRGDPHQIEKEMKQAPAHKQWAVNHCLAQIGICHRQHRKRAIAIGERLAVCTPPYAPVWIAEMVRRQEETRGRAQRPKKSDALSQPTRSAALPASRFSFSINCRASCKRNCFWYCNGHARGAARDAQAACGAHHLNLLVCGPRRRLRVRERLRRIEVRPRGLDGVAARRGRTVRHRHHRRRWVNDLRCGSSILRLACHVSR